MPCVLCPANSCSAISYPAIFVVLHFHVNPLVSLLFFPPSGAQFIMRLEICLRRDRVDFRGGLRGQDLTLSACCLRLAQMIKLWCINIAISFIVIWLSPSWLRELIRGSIVTPIVQCEPSSHRIPCSFAPSGVTNGLPVWSRSIEVRPHHPHFLYISLFARRQHTTNNNVKHTTKHTHTHLQTCTHKHIDTQLIT